MSVISSLPPEIIQNILCLLPPKEIATNYRFVCSQWNIASRELKVWHIAAESLDLEYEETATAKEVESFVARLLVRRECRVSTPERLLAKFNGCFSEIPSGTTRAFCYRSSSNKEAVGYFMLTKDSQFNFEERTAPGAGKDSTMIEKIKALFVELKGLTVVGSKEADYAQAGMCVSTGQTGCGHSTLIYMDGLSLNLLDQYFNHNDNDINHLLLEDILR